MIQSRAMDNLLRLYFSSQEVRELLGKRLDDVKKIRSTIQGEPLRPGFWLRMARSLW